jgi:diguanylate cyclase (GGDEF)-like protein/PAS domain S-box-containing protein
MSDLPLTGQRFFVALTLSMVGLTVLLVASAAAPDRDTLTTAGVLTVLLAVAWLYPLPIAFKRRLYFDTSVLIAAIILLPTGYAMAAAGFGTLLAHLVRRQGWVEAAFNAALMMAQAAVGGLVLVAFDARNPPSAEEIAPILLAGVAMYVVNHLLVGTMVAIQSGRPTFAVWRQAAMDDGGIGILGHLSQVAVGALAVYLLEKAPWALLLLLVPTVTMYLAVRGWIRQRQRAEAARPHPGAGPRQAQRAALIGTWEWNLRTGDSVWSEATHRIVGLPRGASATSYEALLRATHPEDRDQIDRAVHYMLRTGEPASAEHRIVLPDGTVRFVEQRGEIVADTDGGGRLVTTIQDVTERKSLDHQLARQAFHDPVTGLPNRTFALDHLARLLAAPSPDLGPVAVVVIEVDAGAEPSAGNSRDDLVREAARRLRSGIHEGELLARFGVSRLTVVFQATAADAATERAADLSRTLGTPIDSDGADIDLRTCVGTAVSGALMRLPQDLVAAAEADLGLATPEDGLSHPAEGPAWSRALVSGARLRDALDRRELTLHYKPEVTLATGEIVGFEALLRWRHPSGVWLLPEDFLPVAEASGLTAPIGRWTLNEACRVACTLPDASGLAEPLSVSVDVASGHFHQPSFVDDVTRALDESGLDAEALWLDVTEPTVVEDVDASRRTLETLRDLGVRVAIDDFDAGYASLGNLQRLPIDALKLHRMLIASLEVGEADRAIVQATASLVRASGRQAFAKGIETPWQLAWAQALGCERGQGSLFAGPLDAERLSDLLDDAARAGGYCPAPAQVVEAARGRRDE